jgi:hypothetical protein
VTKGRASGPFFNQQKQGQTRDRPRFSACRGPGGELLKALAEIKLEVVVLAQPKCVERRVGARDTRSRIATKLHHFMGAPPLEALQAVHNISPELNIVLGFFWQIGR